MTVLLDSVILIDYLNAVPAARAYVDARYAGGEAALSVVTTSEVLVGVDDTGLPGALAYLDAFPLLLIDREAAIDAARLRRRYRWKLPDALQAALARRHGLRLATRNTKDFDPATHAFVDVPYTL